MKFLNPLIASAVLLSISSTAFALSQTDQIIINVTEAEFLTVSGTIVADASVDLAVADVTNGSAVLGTLGADSNVSATCSVTMTTANTFQLLHTLSGAPLHAAAYSITYDGNTYTPAVSAGTTDCSGTTGVTSNVLLNGGGLATTVASGVYTDILTVTIATQ